MSQLTADVEGTIDEAVVGRYYTGRAEASSFTVADRAVEGRAAEALEALRWSLATGVAPVLITSALAQGVRAIGKLSSARGGRPRRPRPRAGHAALEDRPCPAADALRPASVSSTASSTSATIRMMSTGATHELLEIGTNSPEMLSADGLGVGEVGYLITGVKDVRQSKVGDTVTSMHKGAQEALGGYKDPRPMVFSGLYPLDGSDYPELREALDKLQLNDAALVYEPETSAALGFGFRAGFLGLLHLDVIRERLEREFGLDLIATAPNVVYRVSWRTAPSTPSPTRASSPRARSTRSTSRSFGPRSSRRPSSSARSWSCARPGAAPCSAWTTSPRTAVEIRAHPPSAPAASAPAGLRTKHAVADRLVYAKIREGFGGRLRACVSGSAALAPEIGYFFAGAGIHILEGYGLTESSAASFVNPGEAYRTGTVGKPLPGTEVRIADDGEILLRGPGIMEGYHKLPEKTAEVLEPDGWFHTGDIGELSPDGYLRITDRKKDLIKTSGGKYIAPAEVEGQFKAVCPYVSNILVHGADRNFCTALIALDEVAITEWAKENGLEGKPYAEIVAAPVTVEMVDGYVKQLNEGLQRWQTIKKFRLLPRDLDVEHGEITPSLKLKRPVVEREYKNLIEEMYEGSREA
ncbi:Elongation factor 4 [Streptomyces tendae]